jgi:hypothetical protein
MMRHSRKWEAFYALEALVRRRHAERPRPLAHLALLVASALLSLVCGLNDAPLAAVPQLQAMAQSLFCVVIGGLYAVYMLTAFLARAVMHCAGERSSSNKSNNINRPPPSDYIIPADNSNNEEEEELCDEEAEGGKEEDFDVLRNQTASGIMTREQVVASMYLGGVGAFLALGPLCMWNCALTLAFLVSLLGVALTIESAVMSHTAWILMGASALTLGCSIGIECSLPMTLRQSRAEDLFFSSEGAAAAVDNTHSSGSSNNNITAHFALLMLQMDAPTQTRAWPAWLVLSAASPPLLYAGLGGGGRGSPSMMMAPSKTLETGLPVSLLLACILLGWFNPIESALWAHHPHVQPRLLILLLVAPLLLVSVLAFLMHALRSRSVLPALAVLIAVMVARQQSTRASPPRVLDAAAITFATVALIAAAGRLRASFALPVARRT